MKVKYILGLLALIFIVSCGDKTSETLETGEAGIKQEMKKISTKAIENFKYNDYILSDDAKREVSDWSKFQELETQISFLKTADITFFTTEKDTLKKFLDILKVNIPENINTNPVNARITTLETKLFKLNNDLTLENYSVDSKMLSIKELLIANSNLIFVINKKLEFDKNDVGRPEDE